jgi:uncharacterized protein YndB with AHSA1/START domain
MTTTSTLELDIPPGEPVIAMRRFVQAPPELVFAAYTDPEHLKNWWGPRYLTLTVDEIDVRPGGRYRFVHTAPDGGEHAFHGEYREVDPPRRLVTTFVYEGMPDDEAVETMEFQAVDGGTLIVGHSLHGSVEARDEHIANGMEQGMRESYDRLDDLLATLV